jgi:ABC-2 type transport system permease protein
MKPLVIAGNSMRRFLRDRTTVFFTIVLPVMIIFIVGNATSRFDDPVFPVGIVDEGSGSLGAELKRSLEREPAIELDAFDDRESLAKLVRRGGVAAGLVLPASFEEDLRARKAVQIELLVDQTRGFPAAVRSLVSEAVAKQGATLQAASFAARRAGRSFDESLAEAKRTSELVQSVAIGVRSENVGNADEQSYLPPGFNYQAPSNLLLFVFITSLAGSAVLIQSRQLRVTHRMLGTPTTARTILLGETLSRFATAAFQALFIFLVGTFLFGVRWGPPIGATAVIVLFVLVGTSVGMLFGTIFRTPEQAGAIGAPMGIAAGMLGGCMWPLEIVPKGMQQFGHIFPHAWAMDAWIEMIGRGGDLADITTELAVLAGYVAVLFPLATWRLRRAIVA